MGKKKVSTIQVLAVINKDKYPNSDDTILDVVRTTNYTSTLKLPIYKYQVFMAKNDPNRTNRYKHPLLTAEEDGNGFRISTSGERMGDPDKKYFVNYSEAQLLNLVFTLNAIEEDSYKFDTYTPKKKKNGRK